MRRSDSGWSARCDGEEFTAERLREAMRDAVGHDRGETLQLGAAAHDAIEAWVADQSARIEREAEGG